MPSLHLHTEKGASFETPFPWFLLVGERQPLFGTDSGHSLIDQRGGFRGSGV